MDKVMPTIEMPNPEPEAPEVPVSETDNKDIIDEIMEEIENDDRSNHIIEVTEREIPDEDDVFDEPPPKVEPIVNTEFIDPNERKGKRKYNRKAPMSDKQKEHLAKIRKIAQEKRKTEKERKAKEKEEQELLKAEERLIKKKKAQEEKQQKEQTASQPPPPAQPIQSGVKYFTEEDLNKAVLGAVHTYDTYRKAQKKEKKAKQAEEAKQAQMRRTIQNAITPQNTAQATDPWRGLFT